MWNAPSYGNFPIAALTCLRQIGQSFFTDALASHAHATVPSISMVVMACDHAFRLHIRKAEDLARSTARSAGSVPPPLDGQLRKPAGSQGPACIRHADAGAGLSGQSTNE